MKHIIILGDGMADHAVERLGNKTPLQYANIPYMDMLAKNGRTGLLQTVPKGYSPGSEVANTTILGYDLNKVFEGRGPLEAASIGYEMGKDDFAIRCNIICIEDDIIKNHHAGHITTNQARELIKYLNKNLATKDIFFIAGIQYRHLLIIRGGSKHIVCFPPHDHPDEKFRPLLVKPEPGLEDFKEEGRMTPRETANLINDLILKSQELLSKHPFNIERKKEGKDQASSIWTWSGGYRPNMHTLNETYPEIKSGAVISAVDLIQGIGHYAGLRIIKVEGATGLYNTNYEGKANAAIEALKTDDFVFLHVEASDEAGHEGNLDLKLKTIQDLDNRIIRPIYEEVKNWSVEPVTISVLPDHPTPVEIRTHVNEPVPFLVWHNNIEPDKVKEYSEISCKEGYYGLVPVGEFLKLLMNIK